jgi:hypothetical protein
MSCIRSIGFVICVATLLSVVSGVNVWGQELKIGGYFQTWIMPTQNQKIEYSENTEQFDTWGFRIRRARINAGAKLNHIFHFNSLFEFAGRDRNLMDFYLTATFSNLFTITAGQFIPAGQMFDTGRLRSSTLLFYERPTISGELSRFMRFDSFRDIGIMINGKSGPLWYAAHIGNGLGRYSSAGDIIYDRKFGQGLYGARIDLDIIPELMIGGHYSINRQENVGQTDSAPITLDRSSYSFRAATDGLALSGLFTQFEYGNFTNAEGANNISSDGWYLTAGYRISPKLSILGRYDTFSTDISDLSIKPKENNITFGGLYIIKEEYREILRVGLNYAYGDRITADTEEISNRTHKVILWIQVRSMP